MQTIPKPQLKTRVTWLVEGGLESSYAVVEYLGSFPGLASHGNSLKDSEYIRTTFSTNYGTLQKNETT